MAVAAEAVKTSEKELIARAQAAVSQCNWDVGECAAQWTKRFAKGRTDADFATLVGLSGDQVYQRRRVWETFCDVREQYANLKWSHFYAALTWEDAAECLQWAEEIGATVAEMKAWRRAQRGEDLSTPAEDDYSELMLEPAIVRNPADSTSASNITSASGEYNVADGQRDPVMASAARMAGDDSYAPFLDGAQSVPGASRDESEEPPTPQALLRKLTAMLERASALITPGLVEEFPSLKEKDRKRFVKAFKTLAERAGEMA